MSTAGVAWQFKAVTGIRCCTGTNGSNDLLNVYKGYSHKKTHKR